jgi:hypothetical protein
MTLTFFMRCIVDLSCTDKKKNAMLIALHPTRHAKRMGNLDGDAMSNRPDVPGHVLVVRRCPYVELGTEVLDVDKGDLPQGA